MKYLLTFKDSKYVVAMTKNIGKKHSTYIYGLNCFNNPDKERYLFDDEANILDIASEAFSKDDYYTLAKARKDFINLLNTKYEMNISYVYFDFDAITSKISRKIDLSDYGIIN